MNIKHVSYKKKLNETEWKVVKSINVKYPVVSPFNLVIHFETRFHRHEFCCSILITSYTFLRNQSIFITYFSILNQSQ